jgi:hypothetical protein
MCRMHSNRRRSGHRRKLTWQSGMAKVDPTESTVLITHRSGYFAGS